VFISLTAVIFVGNMAEDRQWGTSSLRQSPSTPPVSTPGAVRIAPKLSGQSIATTASKLKRCLGWLEAMQLNFVIVGVPLGGRRLRPPSVLRLCTKY
jgi:hypothetical protein